MKFRISSSAVLSNALFHPALAWTINFRKTIELQNGYTTVHGW